MNIGQEVAALKRMTVRDLRGRYAEVFGEQTNANNKPWLIKRIAWRIQSLAEGGLSVRAKKRAAELANDADVRLSPPKPKRSVSMVLTHNLDQRLPPPGSILTRDYKNETYEVQVLANGFEFEGEVYKTLTGVAKAITGQHCNGFQFFRLGKAATK